MKTVFNRSLFLAVMAFTSFNLLTAAASSSSSSSRSSARPSRSSEYALLSKADFDQVMYHSGNPESFRFYGEYRAMRQPNGDWLFPLRSCDPVTVGTLGTLRYFFPSAIEGKTYDHGYSSSMDRVSPLKIEASTPTHVIAVRGKHDGPISGPVAGRPIPTNYRVELYLGYDQHASRKHDKKTMCAASLLYLQVKSTNSSRRCTPPHMRSVMFGGIAHAMPSDVGQAVTQRCEEKGLDRSYWDCRKPEFQAVLKELLGDGWTSHQYVSRHELQTAFFRNQQVVGFNRFDSSEVYWTATENKLKGFVYSAKR